MALTWHTRGLHVDSTSMVTQEPTVDGGSGHGGASRGVHREEGTIGVSLGGLRAQADGRVNWRQGLSYEGATDFDNGELWRCSGDFKVAAM